MLITGLLEKGEHLSPAALMNHFEDAEQVKPVSAILMDDTPVESAKLEECIKTIMHFYRLTEIERIKQEISKASEEEAAVLMNKMITLKKEM